MALLPRWPAIQLVSDVVNGVEALGVTIMVNGGLLAFDDHALIDGPVAERARKLP